MAIHVDLKCVRIDNNATSGAGWGGETTQERTVGSNSVFNVGGSWYVFTSSNVNKFVANKSTDNGVTWGHVGGSFTPTVWGGGFCQLRDGSRIYVAYTERFTLGLSSIMYLTYFDTATDTWGPEINFNWNGMIAGVEGPYRMFLRADGSIVFVAGNTVGTSGVYCATYDGAFHGPFGPFAAADGNGNFCAAIQNSDDTIHIFYSHRSDGNFYHQSLSPLDVVSVRDLVGTSANILNWNGDGIGDGYESAGTIYVSIGRKTADYPTIWGRPAIIFGTPGAWTLGALLDMEPVDSDFSVYDCSLTLQDTNIVYSWRGVSSDGLTFIERVGYAPAGSENTPAKWTWITAYNYTSPAQNITSEAPPYEAENPVPVGMIQGLLQDGTTVRYVVTCNFSTVPFVAYLFDILIGAVLSAQVSSIINPNGLPAVILPQGPTIDNTGAVRANNVQCYPPRIRG